MYMIAIGREPRRWTDLFEIWSMQNRLYGLHRVLIINHFSKAIIPIRSQQRYGKGTRYWSWDYLSAQQPWPIGVGILTTTEQVCSFKWHLNWTKWRSSRRGVVVGVPTFVCRTLASYRLDLHSEHDETVILPFTKHQQLSLLKDSLHRQTRHASSFGTLIQH